MRKVFFSTAKLNYDDPKNLPILKSRDFELGERMYFAPISYLLDSNIDENDNVLIITDVMQTENPKKNYEFLKKDMMDILKSHNNDNAKFEVLESLDPKESREEMDSLTFSRYFKNLSSYFQDDDKIYADMTFGLKCNALSVFMSIMYAAKAGINIDVERLIYSEYYRGEKDNKDQPNTSDIIDITGLFYISEFINNAKNGQKKDMDELLKFMIG